MRKINQRQDFYFKKAKEQGYPARSIYKLQEIDRKFRVLKHGDFVLDLGCAPGSWLEYISRKIGMRGKVIGIDMEDIKIPLKKNMRFMKREIKGTQGINEINGMEGINGKFDAVVSDMAPKTTGVKFADVAMSLELTEIAFEIAKKFLKPGGNFVCKIFEGEGVDQFLKEISKSFKSAKRFRPQATRKESREIYFIGKEYNTNSRE